MNIVTLAEIQAHARIDCECQSEELEFYAESAEAVVETMLGRSYFDLLVEYGTVPVPVKHAVLMLVSFSYSQREPASVQNLSKVPYTIDALLRPYMVWED